MVFLRAAPQPLGGVLWWGFFACQLAWGAARCWQRTRLAYAAAAMAVAAVTAAFMCALTIAGYPFPDLPRAGWILFAAGGLAPLILFQLEARLHPLEWRHWKEYGRDKSAWDILTGRHIPEWHVSSDR